MIYGDIPPVITQEEDSCNSIDGGHTMYYPSGTCLHFVCDKKSRDVVLTIDKLSDRLKHVEMIDDWAVFDCQSKSSKCNPVNEDKLVDTMHFPNPHFHTLAHFSSHIREDNYITQRWRFREKIHKYLGDQVVAKTNAGKIYNRSSSISLNKHPVSCTSGLMIYMKSAYITTPPKNCKKDFRWNKEGRFRMIYSKCPNDVEFMEEKHKEYHPSCFELQTTEVFEEDKWNKFDKNIKFCLNLFEKYGPLPFNEMMVLDGLDHSYVNLLIGLGNTGKQKYANALYFYIVKTFKNLSWEEVYYVRYKTSREKEIARTCPLGLQIEIENLHSLLVHVGIDADKFAYDLYNMFTIKDKAHCMYIWGPKDTGKSFIAQEIRKMLVREEFTADYNACSRSFAWDDAAKKPCLRLIHMEENSPDQFTPSKGSVFKQLFEGGKLNMESKWEKASPVSGVPVLITSNYSPEALFEKLTRGDVMSMDALRRRVIVYHFKNPFNQLPCSNMERGIPVVVMIEFIKRYHSIYEKKIQEYNCYQGKHKSFADTYEIVRGQDRTVVELEPLPSFPQDAGVVLGEEESFRYHPPLKRRLFEKDQEEFMPVLPPVAKSPKPGKSSYKPEDFFF